jgi:hypothetical protein
MLDFATDSDRYKCLISKCAIALAQDCPVLMIDCPASLWSDLLQALDKLAVRGRVDAIEFFRSGEFQFSFDADVFR